MKHLPDSRYSWFRLAHPEVAAYVCMARLLAVKGEKAGGKAGGPQTPEAKAALAEAVADVVFRPVPLSEVDAYEMIEGLATQKLLGAFRGEAAVDAPALAAVLMGLVGQPLVRCDAIPWQMFGISMAGWNFIVSLLLVGAATWLMLKPR
mgnify:CR=1 FL=1